MNPVSVSERANAALIEEYYQRWQDNPDSVDPTWRAFFQGFTLAGGQQIATPAAAPAGAVNIVDSLKQAHVHYLINAYRAIARADGRTPSLSEPAAVTRAALDGTDEVAAEALEFFVTCLGRTAGDVALVFKSRGGVFLTGGIAQKIVPALKAGKYEMEDDDSTPNLKGAIVAE